MMGKVLKSFGIIFLFPLNWLWSFILLQRRAYYKYTRGQKKFPLPIISVGNISHGGTGKTPLVLWLAKKLEYEFKTVIITRGYKSRFEKKGFVINPGEEVDGSVHGDEASLLAENLERTHIVLGKKRAKNLKKFLDLETKEIGVLEDGFQHLQIARDLEIVLIDSCIGLEEPVFFPLKYREPFEALGDVDMIILTNCHLTNREAQGELIQRLKHYLRPECKIFRMGYELESIYDSQRRRYPLDFLEGKKVFAFCGIARPDYFRSSLRFLGAQVVGELFFKDHYQYSEKSLHFLKNQQDKELIFVTTEKDFVKIEEKVLDCPCFWVKLKLNFYGEEENFFSNILGQTKKQDIEMNL